MKKQINKVLEILFSKVTVLTVLIHWLFFLFASYQKGFLDSSFHFTYEPFFYQIAITLNIIPISLVEELCISATQLIKENYPIKGTLFYIVAITLQWILIGCMIKAVFFQKKKDAI